MRKDFTLALLVSAFPVLAYAQQPPAVSDDQCALLVTTVQDQNDPSLPITLIQAQELQRAGDQTGCSTALVSVRTALASPAPGQGGAPADAGAPVAGPGAAAVAQGQANVIPGQEGAVAAQGGGQIQTQAEAAVIVQQPMPEIIVRQPAPTITIDIPQPEIIVHMPSPQVSVQPGQAQVMAEGAQPTVRYEQAEPQIVINRAPGEPTVRFEQMQAGQEGNLVAGAAPTPGAGGVGPNIQSQPGEQQAALDAQPNAGQAQAPSAAEFNVAITTRDLVGKDVLDQQGERIGEVEQILVYANDNQNYVVINHDGAMNLGDKRVALALSDLYMQGDQVILPASTQQVQALPAWQTAPGYTEVPADQNLQIRNNQ
jgi:sporulation protein YlmC with PRC-barrel domain